MVAPCDPHFDRNAAAQARRERERETETETERPRGRLNNTQEDVVCGVHGGLSLSARKDNQANTEMFKACGFLAVGAKIYVRRGIHLRKSTTLT